MELWESHVTFYLTSEQLECCRRSRLHSVMEMVHMNHSSNDGDDDSNNPRFKDPKFASLFFG